METETINKLFLELSQITTAKTKREINVLTKLNQLRDRLRAEASASSLLASTHRAESLWRFHMGKMNAFEHTFTLVSEIIEDLEGVQK